MKKQEVVQELDLDIDLALEEVAKKLRPSAQGGCGETAIPSEAYHTKGQTCGCPCCSGSPGCTRTFGC
jgi:hypothetical protein